MTLERTLVLVKPDGVQRGLVGDVIARLERRGLHLVGLKLMQIDEALASRHYAEHVAQPSSPGPVRFITSAPVVEMVLEGPAAVALVRSTMGATNPATSAPGTIRGDLAVSIGTNIVHGSDSPERAAVEIELFFGADELVTWESAVAEWTLGG